MDISFLISWKTVPHPVAWTIGRCPYCHGLEAIRIEDSVIVVSVNFLPIIRSPTGKQTASCGFCERAVDLPVALNRIDIASWEPHDGIDALATKLGMNGRAMSMDRNHETRMRSLLSAVEEASTLDRLDISFGLTTGLLLGGVAGGVAGYYIVPPRLWGMDDVGRVFAGIFAGLVLGAIIGASFLTILRRRSVPFSTLRKVCRDYQLDPASLLALAGDSPRRVQSALRRIRDFWLLEPRD